MNPRSFLKALILLMLIPALRLPVALLCRSSDVRGSLALKDYGKNLVAFLAQYYQKQQERELFEVVSQYYRFLRQLRLEFTQGATVIRAAEVAEISGMAKSEDFLGFLLGELEGIVSVLRNEPLRCTEPVFEGNDLILKLTQQ